MIYITVLGYLMFLLTSFMVLVFTKDWMKYKVPHLIDKPWKRLLLFLSSFLLIPFFIWILIMPFEFLKIMKDYLYGD